MRIAKRRTRWILRHFHELVSDRFGAALGQLQAPIAAPPGLRDRVCFDDAGPRHHIKPGKITDGSGYLVIGQMAGP
jgi:hypothetical protein